MLVLLAYGIQELRGQGVFHSYFKEMRERACKVPDRAVHEAVERKLKVQRRHQMLEMQKMQNLSHEKLQMLSDFLSIQGTQLPAGVTSCTPC